MDVVSPQAMETHTAAVRYLSEQDETLSFKDINLMAKETMRRNQETNLKMTCLNFTFW